MTRIAHLTDLHLLETGHAARAMREKMRLSFLTLGRAIDAELHRRCFEKALDDAWKARADHLVISGDLTEDGLPEQFEILAEVLFESRWSPDDVTIVPGNHDAYVEVHAFERALAGPLSGDALACCGSSSSLRAAHRSALTRSGHGDGDVSEKRVHPSMPRTKPATIRGHMPRTMPEERYAFVIAG